jgi:N-acetylneuraminic acid mutarotase
MITPRGYASFNLIQPENKTLLAAGGFYNGSYHLSSCEKLDIAAHTWSSARNLLGPRRSHCSVLFNNNIVVMGGDNAGTSLNTCEQYDAASNTWSSFPRFSAARAEFGAAVVFDKIYAAGGHNGAILSSVEVYNGSSWSLLPSLLTQARYGCVAVAFQNKLIVLGGNGITTIEVFDPVTSTWNTTFPPMKISPSRFQFAAVSL